MITQDIKLFPKNQRIIGLDLGKKTIGVAISDILHSIATPMETIKRKKFTEDAEVIFKIIAEHNVGGVVIGLPTNMDGSEGASCQSVRQFARNMLKIAEITIYFQDERMSTQAVQKAMKEGNLSTARRGELVDKLAAGYILQSFLDRLRAYD